MRRTLALVLFVLGFALPSWGETCNDSADSIWSVVTAGTWTGCTASADDDFIIDSHDVVVTGDIIINAGGSITVRGTGSLTIVGDILVEYGDSLTVDAAGASFTANGTNTFTCPVTAHPDLGASVDEDGGGTDTALTANGMSLQFGLDCDFGLTAVGDWIRVKHPFEEHNWDAGHDLSKVPVHVGPGRPAHGYFRPEPAAGKWYRIDSINNTTKVITVNLDYGLEANAGGTIYTAGASAPYAGTRTWPITTPVDVTTVPVVYALNRSSRSTRLTGLGALTAQDEDFGARVFHFTEAGGGDCAGNRYKIRRTNNNGATDDIVVDGDLTGCVVGTYEISDGVGRGTVIQGWKPVILSGDHDTDFIGEGYVEYLAGTIKQKGVIYAYTGWHSGAVGHSPTISATHSILVAEASSGVEPTGSIDTFAVLWSECFIGGTNGTLVSSSNTLNNAAERFAGSIVDGDLKFRHGYIADSRPGGAGACQGRLIDESSAQDEFIRLERNSDTGYAANFGVATGAAFATKTTRAQLDIAEIIAYEHINGSSSGETGIDLRVQAVDADGTAGNGNHQYLSYAEAGWLNAVDLVSIGQRNPPNIYGLGFSVDGLVTSSVLGAGSTLKIAVFANSISTDVSLTNATRYKPRVVNFDAGLLGESVGATTNAYMQGAWSNGWVWGITESGSDDPRISFTSEIRGVVADVNNSAGNGSRVFDGPAASGAAGLDSASFIIEDTIVVARDDFNTGHLSYQWERLDDLFRAVRVVFFGSWAGGPPKMQSNDLHCLNGTGTCNLASSLTTKVEIDGLCFIEDETPSANQVLSYGHDATPPTGSYVRNVYMATQVANTTTAFGSLDDGSNHVIGGIGRTGDQPYRLTDFLLRDNTPEGIEHCFAKYLGPQRRSNVFVMLSDSLNGRPEMYTSAPWFTFKDATGLGVRK